MKKRADKKKEVEALRKELERTYHLFVTSFEKLTVAQDFELRKAIRGAGGRYRVIKNNLAAKAAEGTPAESLLQGSAGHDLAGVHGGRPGGAGQGADGVCQGQSGIHVQGGHGGRPGDRRASRSANWRTCRRRSS